MPGATSAGPLSGITVVDVSRMLPGAVLARTLLDFGARWIKVEQPTIGDPMRALPPLIDGTGAGFCAFFRGAESIDLDLKQPDGAAALRKLVRHADVLVESFRPGTLELWGVGTERLMQSNPSLIVCSLTAYGAQGRNADRVGHDVNFVASTGLLSQLGSNGVPGVQLADVGGALLASTSILAALAGRQHDGRGVHLRQPLCHGPLPFLTQTMADASAGGPSAMRRMLSGACPAYRLYRCGDGLQLAVGALEPKFWSEFTELLGLVHLAALGLDSGAEGQRAAREVQQVLETRPRADWLEACREGNLPVSAVRSVEEALSDAALDYPELLEATPVPGGSTLPTPGCYSALGKTPRSPAPRLGQHTPAILDEFGIPAPR